VLPEPAECRRPRTVRRPVRTARLGGEAVPDEMVQEMPSRAEAVTGGIPVVIEITNGGMWP